MRGWRLSPQPRRSEPPGGVPHQPSSTAAPCPGTTSSSPAHPMSELGLGHLQKSGPPPNHPGITQLGEEVLGAIEVLHLDINGPELFECVSVRTCTGRNAQDFA